MSGTRWEWRDSGSSSGHMQKVADSGTFNRVQAAYRAFLGHASGCGDCGHGATRCPTADDLWRAYRAAQR
ncbi:hypothetical protein [Streptomyces sp. NBC_00620]|uniref:hypothetical protein n=1 Tax=unclassified Streptomyces TaxID=2593676 RepID=UPI0022535ABF|nr:hypothetical protein [Streptomyces sp. NBC_00620]MCX4973281.1 hypothetical protein [Streptomyces sp. NBC_00620]WUC12303.1 hypothetical protein OG256_21505 [Streptomyces sp. NBC_00564]WUC51153.1 hypothetical protein OG266_23305 [Streptomyces sp. NBC_00554]